MNYCQRLMLAALALNQPLSDPHDILYVLHALPTDTPTCPTTATRTLVSLHSNSARASQNPMSAPSSRRYSPTSAWCSATMACEINKGVFSLGAYAGPARAAPPQGLTPWLINPNLFDSVRCGDMPRGVKPSGLTPWDAVG